MDLQGQVAIVTGGGRGIGRATALELARLGADVVVAEMDKAGAERTAGEVGALGRRSLAIGTDVTKRGDLAAMVERTKAELGRIDVARAEFDALAAAGFHALAAIAKPPPGRSRSCCPWTDKPVRFRTEKRRAPPRRPERGAGTALAPATGSGVHSPLGLVGVSR